MPFHRARKSADTAVEGQSFTDCLTAALRFLSYRPRTVKEVERRLEGQFAALVVERTIAYLHDLKYLDDASFCAQWVGSRERRRPRGARALRQELRRLGVAQDLVEEAIEGIDETVSAGNAGRRQASKLAAQGCELRDFRHKLTPFLQRRGFGYGATREAIELLWAELQDC
jgi:regulatory protein